MSYWNSLKWSKRFLTILLGTSLLGKNSVGKGINRAGEGIVRAGYGNKMDF